jgi:hypothetical protein
MTDDRPSAADEGFADPTMLRTFFEEQDDEIANAHGLAMQGLDQTEALRTAFASLINTLAAQAPAIRDIIIADLEEASAREARRCAAAGQEYDLSSCAFSALADWIRAGRL